MSCACSRIKLLLIACALPLIYFGGNGIKSGFYKHFKSINYLKTKGLAVNKKPLILWWTPFKGIEEYRSCQLGSCLFSENRSLIHDALLKAIIFYGSSFDVYDLPLPRNKEHWWALLHEESPKNQPLFNHDSLMKHFNVTSTFRRESDMPLTLQHLHSIDALTSKTFFFPTTDKNKFLKLHGLSPVIYLQSLCDCPAQRDEYIKELQKHVNVDSYGVCLNNRKLPEHLVGIEFYSNPELLRFIAKYKFMLAIENAACPDYITEKLWRALKVGVVPIYWGSPTVTDWIPNNNSIIHIRDFESPLQLARYLSQLLINDSMYEVHLSHKLEYKVSNKRLIKEMTARKWGTEEDSDKENFVQHFECYVCNEVIEKHGLIPSGLMIANKDHYGCPLPESVMPVNSLSKSTWMSAWYDSQIEADVLSEFISSQDTIFSSKEYQSEVFKALQNKYQEHGEL